jgi:activator of HSP90 ATPase
VKDLVRAKVVPQLRKAFAEIGPTLRAEHGKDIQHPQGHDPSAGFKKPQHVPVQQAAPHSKTEVSVKTSKAEGDGPSVNTTTVTDTEEFRAPASELYKVFTDAQRVAAFTRGQPKVWEGAKVGGKFEIFGGNVSGEFLELREPTRVVQDWRLDQWPKGHHSKLEINFDQNDVDNVTVMRVTWTGVPVGQEEVTKRNWNEYYVRSIKTTFG